MAGILLITLLASSSISADAIIAYDDCAHDLLFVRIQFDDIDDGEFFSICNVGRVAVDLANWSITDGEGDLIFQTGLEIMPMRELTIARSYSSYLRQNGQAPNCSILDNMGDSSLVRSYGSFRLANDGDELILRDARKNIVDCVSFGSKSNTGSLGAFWHGDSVPSPGRGCLLVRQRGENGYLDTDSKSDWIALRVYRPGQSSFYPLECDAEITALILPDHSNLILDFLRSANKRVRICAYEFRSWAMTHSLIGLMKAGVEVEILVEGSPVGGLKDESIKLLSLLHSQGARISVMKSPLADDAVRRYSYLHSKYMTIDDRVSIILSENFVSDIFDVELGRGNRGWGAVMKSSKVTSYLNSLYDSDACRGFSDIIPWSSVMALQSEDRNKAFENRLPTRFVPPPPSAKCLVRIMPFPDVTDVRTGIEKIISEARESLMVELFYADSNWKTSMKGTIVNPILSLILSKMRSFNEIVICLDGSWLSSESDRNTGVLDLLSRSANSNCSEHYFGHQNLSAPFSILHNKGFVMDHRYSVISSVNWGFESACSNRELSVVIDDRKIADFFEDCIMRDIFGDSNEPDLRPSFSLSANGESLILSVSPDSDDSGLKSLTLSTDDGRAFNWSAEMALGHLPRHVDIHAIDLWGNTADLRVTLFPSQGDIGVFGLDLRIAISGVAIIGISYTLISSIRHWLKNRRSKS
ncbi:MAG: phospholipase D-like domain-containing protein [Thermoplasmata archaeon]